MRQFTYFAIIAAIALPFHSAQNAAQSNELRGIAPGSYHLFAWTVMDGAAYRNSDFMKDYNERGTPVRIDDADPHSMDIVVLN